MPESATNIRGFAEVKEHLRGITGRALDAYEKAIREECRSLRNMIRMQIALRFPGAKRMIKGVTSSVSRKDDLIGGRVRSAWYITRFHNDGTDQTSVQVRPYARRQRARMGRIGVYGGGGQRVSGYTRSTSREKTRGWKWFDKVFEARKPAIVARLIAALTKPVEGTR